MWRVLYSRRQCKSSSPAGRTIGPWQDWEMRVGASRIPRLEASRADSVNVDEENVVSNEVDKSNKLHTIVLIATRTRLP